MHKEPLLPTLAPSLPAVAGSVDAGKSTLVAVLTHGSEGRPLLDNCLGSARMSVFRHKHEIETGRTSSISQQMLGYDREGEGGHCCLLGCMGEEYAKQCPPCMPGSCSHRLLQTSAAGVWPLVSHQLGPTGQQQLLFVAGRGSAAAASGKVPKQERVPTQSLSTQVQFLILNRQSDPCWFLQARC